MRTISVTHRYEKSW